MVHHRKNQGHRDTASQVEPGTHDQKRPRPAPGYRIQGEVDREHKRKSTEEQRQATRNTTLKAARRRVRQSRRDRAPGVSSGRGGCWTTPMTGPGI